MSKNASSGSDDNRKPDNPQETLKEDNFYYSGFLSAEMSCSVIKATNQNPKGHYYYAVDFTVSNADKNLLQNINKAVMNGGGVISPIKGAFNLKARGKNRVRVIFEFLDKYPIIAGDLAKNRVALLKKALDYLEIHRGHHSHHAKTLMMDDIRGKLQKIKATGVALRSFRKERASKNAVGHFLAGVLDGDGSFGFKKSAYRKQPFVLVAMKDRKIVELFQRFVQYGNVRKRKDGMYHCEINHRDVLQKICALFLTTYPLRHARQSERMRKLQRILNDYTRSRSI